MRVAEGIKVKVGIRVGRNAGGMRVNGGYLRGQPYRAMYNYT
jgi:hypothetical protein